MLTKTLEKLQEAATPTVFYITGGGSEVISTLLNRGGASSFFLDAQVPYSHVCFTQLLNGYKPNKFCSPEASRQLAVCAYERAQMISGHSNVIGVGATSSLRKNGIERIGREHKIYVSIHGKQQTTSHTVLLKYGDRHEQERVASQTILKAYAEYLNVSCLNPSIDTDEFWGSETAPTTWDMDKQGKFYVPLCKEPYGHPGQNALIFPGSFNPAHDGHIKVARKAYELAGKPVWFEISIRNCSKPSVDWISCRNRIDSFSKYESDPALGGIVLTQEPLFVKKSRLFPGATFIVGMDTLNRIDDYKYYDTNNEYVNAINEMVHRGVNFLAFNRKGVLRKPYKHIGMERMVQVIDDYEDAGENSTEIRSNT